MEQITSFQNPKYRNLGKLHSKKHRDAMSLFIVEGEKEITFALRNGYVCQELWGTEEKLEVINVETAKYLINRGMFEKIGYREKTESILGVFQKKDEQIDLSGAENILVCEKIEKPGNIGALFRIADGAGADLIVFTEQDTDIYSPNVIRNSVGTFFSTKFGCIDKENLYIGLKKHGVEIMVATPEATNPYYKENLSVKSALVVGSEHNGVSDYWKEKADIKLSIPMLGENDSLNVGISVAVVMYEKVRQLS